MNNNTAQPETKTNDMDSVKVVVKNGLPYIEGRLCSYDTMKIRSKIQEFAEVNEEFVLPKKYTYVITKLNGFAKIVKKQNSNSHEQQHSRT